MAIPGTPFAARWVEVARRNPQRAIWVAAFLSVLLSCYPVIFCGRSFVSANIAPMLYPAAPTLPGHHDTRTENFSGSDVQAMMWHDVPNSFIQSRALAQDFELPLWNRFNSCGLTLLGQGQSMFGDPLHMLVIAAAGEAWAWDLKFILAKLLFCSGIGLAVYVSCRSLPVALLLAFSSGFIGFFSYRFNHPAFFSVCYAPWLLLSWLKVSRAETARKAARWSAILLLASWAELNSGTAKEAYMLLLNLHAAGFLIFLLTPTPHRGRKLIDLGIAGAVFVLMAAPVWLTFFEALRKAYVPYKEAAVAYQIQPGLLIGFFDDIFYRAVNPGNLVSNPSLNFLILLGCLLAIVYLRRLLANKVFVGIALPALFSFAMVFGAIPAGLIERIPVINHIWHIDNTFSCVLMIQVILLAGFGFQIFLARGVWRKWKMDFILVVLLFLILLGGFLGFTHATQRIPNQFTPMNQAVMHRTFFDLYVVSLCAALLVLPWMWRMVARRSAGLTMTVALALVCLLAIHWRHGAYLNTNIASIDDYVVNPAPRLNFQPYSPALDFIEKQPGVFRTVGFGNVFFPGYNGIPGFESIYGPDPLVNPSYHELLAAAGVRQEWSWRWIVERTRLNETLPLYSLLNVRYFLDAPHSAELPEMPGEATRLDLKIFRNELAWPRAFFVDKVKHYERIEQFLEMIRQSPTPFGAVQGGDGAGVPDDSLSAPLVTPARDYRLTNNTTTFTVDAPSAGMAVLTEGYVADDFQVMVNGSPAEYFRVNHAFRGVRIPAAGSYVVSYSYWPRHFTVSLVMVAIGALILVAWLISIWRAPQLTPVMLEQPTSA